jgi:hypothetical protein
VQVDHQNPTHLQQQRVLHEALHGLDQQRVNAEAKAVRVRLALLHTTRHQASVDDKSTDMDDMPLGMPLKEQHPFREHRSGSETHADN